MKLYRRYRLALLLVYLQSFFVLGFGLYVFISAKTKNEYKVEIVKNEVDTSFLRLITNRVSNSFSSVEKLVTNSTAAVYNNHPFTPIFPSLSFDGYFEANGVSYATIRGYYYKVGDFIHGEKIISISPQFVQFDNRYVPINGGIYGRATNPTP